MKLYTFDVAPNPRRLGMFLKYKGISLDTEQIDLMKQEQLNEPFRTINPECSVPTLQLEDGSILIDVVAICLYLESQFPEKPLMGRNDLERAQVIGWMHRVFLNGVLSVAEMLRNQGDAFKGRALPGPAPCDQIPELVNRGRERLQAFFNSIDSHLIGRDYMVGDALTQVDIDVFAVCEFAGWVKQEVPASCSQLLSYIERLRAQLA
ncbi:MAG TPA: glutathione S-transferase [Spongiibacteraceae bacterium]|nr:glutathione S-transferase [Spongiibacteraceae bacterium]HCS26250.1 glutathione S-transferase [Spongiibacteraceae bacterium]|tara:strand:+ start:469 stop:1089 length:621 start_codon:yes stop_codon:yes gene_type:complete